MQNILLSSEGGPWPPKSTITAVLGMHHTAVTENLTPALSLLSFRDYHPGQFLPLLTRASTGFPFCTFILPSSPRHGVLPRGQRRSMEDTAVLFIKCNSRLIAPEVRWWAGMYDVAVTAQSSHSLYRTVATPAAVIWCPTFFWAPQQVFQLQQQQARTKTNKPYFCLEASMV